MEFSGTRKQKGPLFLQGAFLINLQLDDIYGFRTFRAFLNIKAYGFPFHKGLETIALDGRVMDKYITAFFGCDKSVALGFIEPFYFSFSQNFYLLDNNAKV